MKKVDYFCIYFNIFYYFSCLQSSSHFVHALGNSLRTTKHMFNVYKSKSKKLL